MDIESLDEIERILKVVKFNPHEIKMIELFVKRVNCRAERIILNTGKVEGAHYNAMQLELAEIKK